MNALVDLLRTTHQGEKVLVFTEYSDTADYISTALADADIPRVGLATGNTEQPAAIARRFSPVSNKLPTQDDVDPDSITDPIDVLVATDVLSEGQNLQDCHVIVNYDLPWAIIRIIQRAGRVDRIGQKSDTVTIYLITHEKIDQQIRLRQRIKDRLGAAAEAFGSDEQFFGGDAEVKTLDDFYNGRIPDGTEDGDAEADAVSEAWLTWTNALTKHPAVAAKVLHMQDMVHSTRAQYLNEDHGGVTCYISTISGVDAFATAPAGATPPRLLTPLEALRIFRAEVDTPVTPPRPDHFQLQTDLVHGPLKPETIAAGNLKGVRKWAWHRLSGTLYGTAAGDGLNALRDRPLTEHATMRFTQARRNKYSPDDLANLVKQLYDEDRLTIRSSEADTVRVVCSIGVQDA